MAKYMREEEDGSITYTHAEKCGDILKTHNIKGPCTNQQRTKNKRILSLWC